MTVPGKSESPKIMSVLDKKGLDPDSNFKNYQAQKDYRVQYSAFIPVIMHFITFYHFMPGVSQCNIGDCTNNIKALIHCEEILVQSMI